MGTALAGTGGGNNRSGLTQLCQQASDAVGDAGLGTRHRGTWPWSFECRRSSRAKTGSTCGVGVGVGNEPTFPFTHTLCWGGGAGVTAPLHMHFTRKVFQIR